MKIIIEVKGEEITLTEDEAQKVYMELQKVFSRGEPVYVPTQPYVPPSGEPHFPSWPATCEPDWIIRPDQITY